MTNDALDDLVKRLDKWKVWRRAVIDDVVVETIAAIAALREDAERYRWLANPQNSEEAMAICTGLWGPGMDAAIDAARKAQGTDSTVV